MAPLTLLDLGENFLCKVFAHLSFKDRVSLACTCQRMAAAADAGSVFASYRHPLTNAQTVRQAIAHRVRVLQVKNELALQMFVDAYSALSPQGQWRIHSMQIQPQCNLEGLRGSVSVNARHVMINAHHITNSPDSTFPAVFAGVQELEVFDISLFTPPLRSLPSTFGELQSLTRLCINTPCDFSAFPHELLCLRALKALVIKCGRRMTSIPDDMATQLTNLVELSLISSGLLEVPPPVLQMTQLQTLKLTCCPVREIPSELGSFTSLRQLSLSGNLELTHLPPGMLDRLTSLTKLVMSYCTGLILGAEVVQELATLTQLRDLDMCNTNPATEFPGQVLVKLGQLRVLGATCASIVSPAVLLSLWHLTSLTLNFNSGGPNTVPDEVFGMPHLTTLWLEGEGLVSTDPSIGHATRLRKLVIIKCNNLSTVAPELGQLTTLQWLSIQFCKSLVDLPATIGHLTSLTTLRVTFTQLATVPDTLGDLRSLQCLHLSSNQITSLPEPVYALPRLTKLKIRGNPITTLSPAVARFSYPASLDVQYDPETFTVVTGN